MGRHHRTLVRHACCVFAVAACALALQGCDTEPYRPYNSYSYNSAIAVPVNPPLVRQAAGSTALRVAAIPRPAPKTAAQPLRKAGAPLLIAGVRAAPSPGLEIRRPTSGAVYTLARPKAVAANAAVAVSSGQRSSTVAGLQAPAPRLALPQRPAPGAAYAAAPQKAIAANPAVAVSGGQRLSTVAGLQTPAPRLALPQAAPRKPPSRERDIYASAQRSFGEAEVEAVRYAGGPCSPNIYRIAWAAADLFHIHPAFVAAVIEIESRCRPDAVSGTGARGLMQLMPASGARAGYRFLHGTDRLPTLGELQDPTTNIQLGVAYLGALEDHFYYIEAPLTRLILVIAAYNCGPDFLDQRLPPEAPTWDTEQAAYWVRYNAPEETGIYVDAVMEKAALYSIAATTARAGTPRSSVSLSP